MLNIDNIFVINARRTGKSYLMQYYKRKTEREKNIERKQKSELEILLNKQVEKQNKKFLRGMI